MWRVRASRPRPTEAKVAEAPQSTIIKINPPATDEVKQDEYYSHLCYIKFKLVKALQVATILSVSDSPSAVL